MLTDNETNKLFKLESVIAELMPLMHCIMLMLMLVLVLVLVLMLMLMLMLNSKLKLNAKCVKKHNFWKLGNTQYTGF